jgi:hypothetical protein
VVEATAVMFIWQTSSHRLVAMADLLPPQGCQMRLAATMGPHDAYGGLCTVARFVWMSLCDRQICMAATFGLPSSGNGTTLAFYF